MTSRMASVVDKHDKSSSRVASFAGYRDHVPLIGNGESDFGILYLEKATLCTAGITFREV